MMEFIERAFVLGGSGWFFMVVLGFCAWFIISNMLEDALAAIIGVPILLFGAALGQQAFKELGYQLAQDKVVNMGIGMSIGLFVASIVMVIVLWAWTALGSRA